MQHIQPLQKWILGAFLLVFTFATHAQENCEEDINYEVQGFNAGGASGYSVSREYRINMTIGQPVIDEMGYDLEQNVIGMGQLSFYNQEPQAPYSSASEGEYLDRIEVKWKVIDDFFAATVTGALTKVYRNGSLMATVPLSQTTFQDFNVFPGEFYTYEIVTTNDFGESRAQEVIGFLNPNGRITGSVRTLGGVSVSDVKVTLTPNLGRTLELDGVDDYVFFNDEVLALSSTYTIEGWFRNLEAREQTIFSALDSGTTASLVKIGITAAGNVSFSHDGNADGDPTVLISKDVYNTTQFDRAWHHVAAVYGATKMYLYVDGQRVAETDNPGEPVSKPAQIELGKDGKDVFSGYFGGHLDEFRIWGLERTREELRKFDDITLIGTEQGLEAYWKFDERFGDKLFDYSVKTKIEDYIQGYICGVERVQFLSPVQAGAYTDEGGDFIIAGIYYGNGTTFEVEASKETSIGFSLDFDGEDDYISFQNERLPLEDELTLEGWFKVGDHPANDMVLFEASNPESDAITLQVKMEADGKIAALFNLNGSPVTLQSTASYDDEFWYHMAFVNDGGNLALYIDGQEIATGSTTSPSATPGLSRMVIGRSQTNALQAGSSYFDGRLDEFRIYNYGRTQNQVNATVNQVLPLDELGIAQQEGLLGYWPFSNGQGIFISDISPNQITGTFEAPQLILTSGDPVVANWDGDDIPLAVEFFIHSFQPNIRNVSLDPSVTAVDRIDFTDISQLGVSGFVRFTGTDCFAEGVEIILNGSSTIPKTLTDEFGKFKLELEPGSTGQTITFESGDHTFVPGFIELPRLVRPIAGINIEDNIVRSLKGKVIGGVCDYPVSGNGIGNARVILSTQPFCYSDTAIVSNATGQFEFQNAPPQDYILYVEHENPAIQSYFDLEGAKEVSLVVGNKEGVTFRYRSEVRVDMEAIAANSCGKAVIAQNEKINLDLFVFEDYFGNRCSVPSGTIRIFDDISDRESQEISFSNGFTSYELRGGVPNILDGGSNPYQKKIQVVAIDGSGDLADATQFAYVTGMLPGDMDFATTSPQMPFMILRAPPGDNSVSFIERGETFSNTMSFSLATEITQSSFGQMELGNTITLNTGVPGATKQTETEVTNSYRAEVSYGQSLNTNFEMTQTFTAQERISTTATNGDVYVGGAMNVLYGASTTMEVNESTCEVVLGKEILMAPNGFATTFIYSEDFIIGTVIPELVALGKKQEANSWKGMIIMNYALKKSAKFVENISFDAGVEYSKEMTESASSNFSFDQEIFIEPSVANEVGISVDNSGGSVGNNTTLRVALGAGESSQGELTRTVGYTLSDDDFGDNFTVNIKADAIYGTPVFELVSGSSSCPYEGDIYDYSLGLGNLAISSLLPDLGAELLQKQVSELVDMVGTELVDPLVGEIDNILGIVGLDGLGETVSDYADVDAAVEEFGDFIGANDDDKIRKQNRVIDFYAAAFDYVMPQVKTLKRESVSLLLDQNVAVDIPEDQQAVFTLNVGNLSQTSESGVYYLTMLQETNPDGAIVKVNGQPLSGNNDISFVLQAGEQVKATLTVDKGPIAFDYQDITLMFYSSCEREWADSRGFNFPEEAFAVRQDISVNFIEVCSPINIADPGDDWVISSIDGDRMTLTIDQYDLQRPEFTEVRFQYRKDFEGEPWINGVSFLKADLDPGFTIFSWDVKLLDDGPYEIRAVSFCDGDIPSRLSSILSGVIDRQAPALLGTPTPADQILASDDVISIEFTEQIKCDNIISLPIEVSPVQGSANNVAVSNTETGLFMDATVTCEGNKLIIVPNIQNKFLEEQVIRVDVLGMSDELGNRQTETITWEFLVRRNPLAWQGDDIQSIVYEGASPQFVRSIRNNGAFGVNVSLSGALDVQTLTETSLPSWLTATPRSFQLQPGATQDVTFTVSNQIGGGEYKDVVTAATSFGAPELRFDVRVLCPEPIWEVDAALFENSMNFTGQLNIRGDFSTDEFDIVAAFVSDELRGVGQVTYTPELENIPGEHPYLVFLTLYTNSTSSEMIEFQVWDASRCQLYGQVAEKYEISINTIALGTPTAPMSITVTNDIIQEVPLSRGWNWISFNLNSSSTETNNLLGSLDNSRGDLVKSQLQFSQYVPNLGWVGPLSKMDSTQAFRIKITKADTLVLLGSPIDFETTLIQLDSGWNWVSFLPPVGMELNEALSGITATADFIIKGQRNFAQYVDFQGWIGSLDFLRPNQGYLLYADRTATLKYPVNNVNARAEDVPEEKVIQLPDGWNITESNYEFNGNIIMSTSGIDAASGDIIGLFDKEVLVGYGEAKYLDFIGEYYFFITAFTNTSIENLDVRLVREGKEYIAENDVAMFIDQVLGSVDAPIVAQFEREALAVLPSMLTSVELYPNPVIGASTLSINLENTTNTTVTLHNLTGQVIYQLYSGRLKAGKHTFMIDKDDSRTKLTAGLYLIQVQTENEIKTIKIIAK